MRRVAVQYRHSTVCWSQSNAIGPDCPETQKQITSTTPVLIYNTQPNTLQLCIASWPPSRFMYLTYKYTVLGIHGTCFLLVSCLEFSVLQVTLSAGYQVCGVLQNMLGPARLQFLFSFL